MRSVARNCLMGWLALGALVLDAGLTPAAGGERIGPLSGEAHPIPGDAGMDFFYGTWRPGGQVYAEEFRTMTIHRDGRITRDYFKPPIYPADETPEFKVVAESENLVLLIVKRWTGGVQTYEYTYWALTYPGPPDQEEPEQDPHPRPDAVRGGAVFTHRRQIPGRHPAWRDRLADPCCTTSALSPKWRKRRIRSIDGRVNQARECTVSGAAPGARRAI